MIKRRTLVLLGLLGLLIAVGLTFVNNQWKLDFGPGLSFVSSMALLAVTWVYVEHTRKLVEAQREQLRAQRNQLDAQLRQSHFAAVSKLWSASLKAEDAMIDARLYLNDPFETGQSHAKRMAAIDKVAEVSKRIRASVDDFMQIVVDIDGALEVASTQAVSHMLDLANDLMSLAIISARELNLATTESRDFDTNRVITEWESPVSPDDRHEVRWADFLASVSIDKMDDELTDLRVACRSELRTRLNAAR